jgi:sirohydrochlorin ferrochelatase
MMSSRKASSFAYTERIFSMSRSPGTPLDPAVVTKIERAIAAIGAHSPNNDYNLDLDVHAKQLRPGAEALRDILLNDEKLRRRVEEYKRRDADAAKARRIFEFAVSILGLTTVAGILLELFLLIVPPEIKQPVRCVLAAIAGLYASAMFAFIGALTTLDRAVEWPVRYLFKNAWKRLARLALGAWNWALWLGTAAVIAYPIYKWLLPNDIGQHAIVIQISVAVILLFCLFATDVVTGGPTAGFFTKRGQSLHSRWYDIRAGAEAIRRQIFIVVLNAVPGRAVPEGADALPLVSQKLEYFRRYQVEVQQSYYADKSHDNKYAAARVGRLRSFTFIVFVAAALYLALSLLGSYGEQGGAWWLNESLTAYLIDFSERGVDDIAILLAFLSLGVYIFLQIRSSLLREQINHIRYGQTLGQLREVTSSEPGKPELAIDLPLTAARRAAALGDHRRVERFFYSVNRLLGSEVGDWNAMTPYAISPVGPDAEPRLITADRLSSKGDFNRVARDLEDYGCAVMRVRKVNFVAARQASKRERVETRMDRKESSDVANPGDWMVTTLNPDRSVWRGKDGNANTYVVRKGKFEELYDRDQGECEFGGLYRPKGAVVDAVRLAGGFDIVAPWNERQQATKGYLIRNGDDVYGIHDDAFTLTYEQLAQG